MKSKCKYNALNIANYIIDYSYNKKYGITNLKLQCLLYFIQVAYILESKDNMPCFKDKIFAKDFGPVVPSVYEKFLIFAGCDISESKQSYIKDEKDKNIINEVIDFFANYSYLHMFEIIKNQEPYKEAYKCYKIGCEKEAEILISTIREYFSKQEENINE